ncbi:MAG: hypothetical protein WDZ39_01100 [Candidatus Spechtbacterales bacterium]
MKGRIKTLFLAYRIWTPIVLAIVAVVSLNTASNLDEGLREKIEAYNQGTQLLDDSECSLDAAENFIEALSDSKEDAEIDARSNYNTGTLVLNCVLLEQLEPNMLLAARSFLIDALREASTSEDLSNNDVKEIRKQLEVVNNLLEEESLMDDGDDSEEGEEGEGEDGEGDTDDDPISDDNERDPLTRFRPRGEF